MPRAPDMPWAALLPGAVVFGVGLEVLHLVTVYWIANQIEHKTDTYGAIGFALALLLWAYLLGRLITSAAVVNATLWTRDVARRKARAAARTRRAPTGAAGGSAGVEAGLGAQRRDDQGELAPGEDRGGEVGGGYPPET